MSRRLLSTATATATRCRPLQRSHRRLLSGAAAGPTVAEREALRLARASAADEATSARGTEFASMLNSLSSSITSEKAEGAAPDGVATAYGTGYWNAAASAQHAQLRVASLEGPAAVNALTAEAAAELLHGAREGQAAQLAQAHGVDEGTLRGILRKHAAVTVIADTAGRGQLLGVRADGSEAADTSTLRAGHVDQWRLGKLED